MEKLSNFSVMVHKKNFHFCVTHEGRVKTCPTGKSFGGRQGMFIFIDDALSPRTAPGVGLYGSFQHGLCDIIKKM